MKEYNQTAVVETITKTAKMTPVVLVEKVTQNSGIEMEILDRSVEFLVQKLFDKELSKNLKIKLTVQYDKNPTKIATYGWASKERWTNGIHELNITANSLTGDFKQIWNTLIHELVHIYGFAKNVPTTSRQGRYHNKAFKVICDQFHLYAEKDSKIGWVTPASKMSAENEALLNEFVSGLNPVLSPFNFFKESRHIDTPKIAKKTSVKYSCPECGQHFTAKKGLHLDCAVCGCRMETED